jgi:hypothetical protein
VIVRYATNPASPLAVSELRHAGGAINQISPSTNAISNRDAQLFFQISAPTLTPEIRAAAEMYYKAALRPHLRGSVYLNFMVGSQARHRVKDAFTPEKYKRLQELKARYDSDNAFRISFQVTPQQPS